MVMYFENGGDYFIPITANYLKSSFGCNLDYLVRYPHPIRSGPPVSEELTKLHLRIPKELWRIIDWLYKYSLDQDELFVETGNQDEMALIRECLDKGEELPTRGTISNHSMAETLLRFIESLPDPIIPLKNYREALDSSNNSTNCRNFVNTLPELNRTCFCYIISFLKEVLALRNENKSNPEQLALIFSAVILRSDRKITETILKRKMNFILNFVYKIK